MLVKSKTRNGIFLAHIITRSTREWVSEIISNESLYAKTKWFIVTLIVVVYRVLLENALSFALS